MLSRIIGWLAVMGICTMLLAGCEAQAPQIAKPAPAGRVANLALGFEPGDTTSYKLVMETDKGYRYEQSSKSKTDEEHTGTTLEMTFTQQIKNVDEQGSAVAKITIKSLKYFSPVKNDVRGDFDSSNERDEGPNGATVHHLVLRSALGKSEVDGDRSRLLRPTGAGAPGINVGASGSRLTEESV